ncbi:MAG TPA: membrane protein insertase YidC [Microbacteriaceae bacterium]|nr:membrane protein insertase YidC [Microbacteriaceae bacterium]
MFEFFGTLLWPLKWVIELILVSFHQLLTLIGLHADQGLTWILSIVGLTLIVRAALIPLFVKQIKSQRKMLEVAPELKRIQDKYKGKKDQYSREAMSRETMALYGKHGTNPFASCLPMLVQMPIFLSLFYTLNDAVHSIDSGKGGVGLLNLELAQSFGNADFLGAPLASTLQHGFNDGNIATIVIAILMIVVMTGAQFITQLQIMAKNQTPEMKSSPMYKQQRILLYILPLVFVFTSFYFPLGVMFYWVASNLWTVGQQFFVIRNMPTPGSEAALAREARLAKRRQRLGLPDPEDTTGAAAIEESKSTQRQQPVSKNRAKKKGPRK